MVFVSDRRRAAHLEARNRCFRKRSVAELCCRGTRRAMRFSERMLAQTVRIAP
jgi:hypothetical protein